MAKPYVVTGTLSNGRIVQLDEPVPLADTKVRVRIEPLLAPASGSYAQVIAEIRRRQSQRGHVPPTTDEVDGYVRAERANWGE